MSYAYDTIADIIRLAEENNISFGDVVPVSYTHLDVYKRQLYR